MSNCVKLNLLASLAVLGGSLAPPIAVAQPDRSLPCYLQTSDGRQLDLGKLCQRSPVERVAPPALRSSPLRVSNLQYRKGQLRGQVTNSSHQPMQSVRVNYEVLDAAGAVMDSGYLTPQPAMIPPGGTATFSGETVSGASVQTTFVEAEPAP